MPRASTTEMIFISGIRTKAPSTRHLPERQTEGRQRRSGKTIAGRLVSAAVACGLTRAQAVDLLHVTVAVGIACVEAPASEAQLRAELANQTRRLVVGVRSRRAMARRAA